LVSAGPNLFRFACSFRAPADFVKNPETSKPMPCGRTAVLRVRRRAFVRKRESDMQGTPKGLTAVTPHLVIRNCGQAIEFYKSAFGAVENYRMPGPGGGIMHAEIRIGDATLFVNDENPEMGARGPESIGGTPITLHLYVADADKAFERATKAGCKVEMPLTNMFWGDRYGVLSDRFGYRWSIATKVEDLTEAQIKERMAKQFCG
jgi:uncharacterized glyoxalase superfamily protein PhnB